MKTTSKYFLGVAATLSLAIAGVVYAHPGSGMGPGMGPGMGWIDGSGTGGQGMGGMGHGMRHGMGGPGMGGMGSGMGPGMAAADMAAAATARTAELKSQLKIEPAQEAAWKAYESVVTQHAGAMQAARSAMQAQVQGAQPGAAAPDFAKQRESMMALRDTHHAAHSAALKDLYAVLTAEQRAIADRNLHSMGAQWMQGRHPAR